MMDRKFKVKEAPAMLGISLASARLGISPGTLRRMVEKRSISHYRVGNGSRQKVIRFSADQLAQYLDKHQVPTAL